MLHFCLEDTLQSQLSSLRFEQPHQFSCSNDGLYASQLQSRSTQLSSDPTDQLFHYNTASIGALANVLPDSENVGLKDSLLNKPLSSAVNGPLGSTGGAPEASNASDLPCLDLAKKLSLDDYNLKSAKHVLASASQTGTRANRSLPPSPGSSRRSAVEPGLWQTQEQRPEHYQSSYRCKEEKQHINTQSQPEPHELSDRSVDLLRFENKTGSSDSSLKSTDTAIYFEQPETSTKTPRRLSESKAKLREDGEQGPSIVDSQLPERQIARDRSRKHRRGPGNRSYPACPKQVGRSSMLSPALQATPTLHTSALSSSLSSASGSSSSSSAASVSASPCFNPPLHLGSKNSRRPTKNPEIKVRYSRRKPRHDYSTCYSHSVNHHNHHLGHHHSCRSRSRANCCQLDNLCDRQPHNANSDIQHTSGQQLRNSPHTNAKILTDQAKLPTESQEPGSFLASHVFLPRPIC
ncbi:unnamed protein product [Protopolystoma xenopodis]|uniref:Uncharacterized protein n=1 Tax=Protopolystoma xenopodis TaxID=117903 RepID=A0A3S5ABN3_9PLAT|nr:unnamed protein product [Protopolystoma xenopodis]